MKQFVSILLLVCSTWGQGTPQNVVPPSSKDAGKTPPATNAISLEKEALQNSSKAKSIIEQGIQALGGQAYLTIRDRELQGRGYGFHHGRPSGGGGPF